MSEQVLFSINEYGLATITLNRPRALNSLTYSMVKEIGEKLAEWKTDDNIKLVIMKGAGEKGFCAGGDIKALYEARSNEDFLKGANDFFETEYKTDIAVYEYPKPIIAILDGIVMGGGVGLAYGASHRIVTERTKWAMPEMNIGLFPDVGAAYFLNKAPGYLGRYLALTSKMIHAEDVLYLNGADAYMPSDKLELFLESINEINWHEVNVSAILSESFAQFSGTPVTEGKLALLQSEIDKYFSHQTLEEIVHSLSEASSTFASETKDILLSVSPVSLKVTLKQLIDGEKKSLHECFATDLVLAMNFMDHDDFFEGARSVLIDKDRNPNYTYKQLSDVSDELVEQFFK